MSKHYDLDELRKQYVGTTFNYLTVIDVIRENGVLIFVCKCKCGTIRNVCKSKVTSGHTTSCGCYKKSKEYRDRATQWLNDHEKVKDRAEKLKQWCKDHPDKVAERGKLHSEWYKNNPDKAAEQGRQRSQFCKDNPDFAAKIGEKVSQWYKNNPDKVKEKADQYRQWCIDNKDYVKELGKQHSLSLRSNPEKLADRGKQHSEWFKTNKETWQCCLQHRLSNNEIKRSKYDYSELLEIIHPDYIDSVCSGVIRSQDKIKTKCPVCGNYAEHSFNTVFIRSRGTFKLGSPPLCAGCKSNLITSSGESEIADYISTFYNGTLIRNTRDIISPLELDLYYPEKKIAIEFNGDYWHNEDHKDIMYHYNKFRQCLEIGVLLISVFESEWLSHKDTIKSYIYDTFAGKQNMLSFKDSAVMNNNYPSQNITVADIVDHSTHFYNYKESRVFTCGYSILKEI